MPFGFPSERAFSFTGIPIGLSACWAKAGWDRFTGRWTRAKRIPVNALDRTGETATASVTLPGQVVGTAS
jgi:hypothetical protein